MPSENPLSETYTPWVGLVYIFNLIVGTGALTMPKAFGEAGWLLSVIGVSVLAFMSYLTATFMIEAMAAANALFKQQTVQDNKRASNLHDPYSTVTENHTEDSAHSDADQNIVHNERVPLLINTSVEHATDSSAVDYFAITEQFEMGSMAAMFYNSWGMRLFYVCIAIYLYGDLAIYSAAVAKSLRDIICEKAGTDDDMCWSSTGVDRFQAYRIFLVLFTISVGPFTFFNVQKTKYLQIITTLLRWTAFISMIVLCLVAIIGGKAKGTPPVADPLQLPNLFGVCVYSFMCHHSLPSLVTPIVPKRRIHALIGGDFLLILCFYNLLSLTGIFTFDSLEDMYTLNFQPSIGTSVVPVVPFLQYFLALFPVLTLSSNFPIIAITLRNNLKTLILNEDSSWPLTKIVLPLLALVPPVLVAFFTDKVEFLVSVTGAYAGAMIQYVVPASLVYLSRRQVLLHLGLGIRNRHASPFSGSWWIPFVMVWTVCCIILVTIHRFV